MSIVALSILLVFFASCVAFAYWCGRRDYASKVEQFRSEWDRRAWLAGRQSVRYELQIAQSHNRARVAKE